MIGMIVIGVFIILGGFIAGGVVISESVYEGVVLSEERVGVGIGLIAAGIISGSVFIWMGVVGEHLKAIRESLKHVVGYIEDTKDDGSESEATPDTEEKPKLNLCPDCGTKLQPKAKFCPKCGKEM